MNALSPCKPGSGSRSHRGTDEGRHHPEYVESTVTCGCGNKFTHAQHAQEHQPSKSARRATRLHRQDEVRGHTGRVEKFQRKYNWDKRKKPGEPAKEEAPVDSRQGEWRTNENRMTNDDQ